MLMAARKTAITAVVSRSAAPKVFPIIRNAEISSAINIAPPRKTAMRRATGSSAVICQRSARASTVRNRSAQGLGLFDQFAEPLCEVRLVLFFRQRPGARRHLEELLDESAQIVGHAEEHEGRRLVFDG